MGSDPCTGPVEDVGMGQPPARYQACGEREQVGVTGPLRAFN